MSNGPTPALLFETLDFSKHRLKTAAQTTYRIYLDKVKYEDVTAETVNDALAKFSGTSPYRIERLGIAVSNVLSGAVLEEVADEPEEVEAAPEPQAETASEASETAPAEGEPEGDAPAEAAAENTEVAPEEPAEATAEAAPAEEPAAEPEAAEEAKTVDNEAEGQ